MRLAKGAEPQQQGTMNSYSMQAARDFKQLLQQLSWAASEDFGSLFDSLCIRMPQDVLCCVAMYP
jgi:hypothetical protein